MEVKRIFMKAARDDTPTSAIRLLRLSRLLQECGGWPEAPGEEPRSDADRMLEIRTQLEHLAGGLYGTGT